ncbi:MAG: alpha/beta fold hydrolase [Solirubrobacterales bacterium]|nr:alpha/beta fold hydrolase [Solirubrobacterales bacterium]
MAGAELCDSGPPGTAGWSEERFAEVGAIELCYQEMGDPAGEPMVLVMGLGMQMIAWEDGLCELLAGAGFRVIRFDNRDTGRSTAVRAPAPTRVAMLAGLRRGLAYTLDDLADDAAGLIDALELDSAHVVGASMGGMIAQVVGYRAPDRVRSLGLIMTGSGKRTVSMPRLRALGALLQDAPEGREAQAEHAVRLFRLIGSPTFAANDERIRAHALAAYDRGRNRAGAARQLHAITASGDRRRRLRSVRAPTVVIHGSRDPLVRPAAGRSVAAAIPGARLVIVPGMGHDLPPEVWPTVAGEVLANARRAPAVRPGAPRRRRVASA